MIGELKPYTEYKDSGLPWLGQVPSHWEVRRIKTVLREVDRRSSTGRETLLSLRMQAGLVDHHALGGKPIPPSALVGYKRVLPGEIVMNRMRASAGLFAAATSDGLVSPDYAIFRPVDRINVAYAVQLFRTPAMTTVFKLESTGLGTGQSGFLRLYSEQFGRLGIPTPPDAEQAAIVRFLNWASGRLERAIRAKRKVIALLTEQRRAIMHRGVTGALLQEGRRYRTGNRWFPELPNGWKAVSLRRVIHSAIDGPHFSPTYRDEGVPFLSSRNIKADRWSLSDVKFISEADYREFSRRVNPKVGDVLYTKGGTTGVARVVDLPFPFQVWVHVAVLNVKQELIDPEYLAACLNSPRCYEQAQLYTRGATNQDLGLGRMKDIVLPVPDHVATQRSVVAQLNASFAPLDADVGRTMHQIDLLREFRVRLTADVVTGRLDVRAAAARLPDVATDNEVVELNEAADEAQLDDEETPA